jgi:MoxR-like ATPase
MHNGSRPHPAQEHLMSLEQLSTLSKLDLVALGRKLAINMGDYARASKVDLIGRITDHSDASQAWAVFMGGAPAGVAGIDHAAPAPAPAASLVAAAFAAPKHATRVIATEKAAKVFGVKLPGSLMVDLWDDPEAPRKNPKYRFDPDLLRDALVSLNRGRPVWMAGPAGTGKTEFAKQLCAYLGRAFVRVQFDASLEAYHIIGGERVRAASTVWQDGLVLQGFRRPGAVILLDEVGYARSEYTSSLHAALEPEGCITVAETGERVERAPGVVFMAADNSNGRGDHTGTYVGVREQNQAFISRFAKTLMFEYQGAAEEAEIVADVTGVPLTLARLVTDFIAVCRAQVDAGKLESPPTLREAFYLVEDIADGIPARRAFENTIVNRSPSDCHEIMQQLWAANVNEAMFKDAADGKPVVLKSAAATQPKEEPAF